MNLSKNTPEFQLTQREYEVMSYVIKGLSNPEIAKIMFLSISTVKAHISSVLEKLKVPNRYAAALKLLNINPDKYRFE